MSNTVENKEVKKNDLPLINQKKVTSIQEANLVIDFSKFSKPNRRELTQGQKLFTANYCLNGFIGKTAYLDAFPDSSERTAGTNALILLKKEAIQEAIKYFISMSLSGKSVLLENELYNFYRKRAFYKISDYIDIKGEPKYTKMDDYTAEEQIVIDDIETKCYGRDAKEITVMKLADKSKAAKELSKYVDFLKEKEPAKIEVTGKDGKDLNTMQSVGVLLATTPVNQKDWEANASK